MTADMTCDRLGYRPARHVSLSPCLIHFTPSSPGRRNSPPPFRPTLLRAHLLPSLFLLARPSRARCRLAPMENMWPATTTCNSRSRVHVLFFAHNTTRSHLIKTNVVNLLFRTIIDFNRRVRLLLRCLTSIIKNLYSLLCKIRFLFKKI